MNEPTSPPDGGVAFPFDPQGIQPECGMSLRDYFAAKALPSLIADWSDAEHSKQCAELAYKVADAMLEARKQ